MLCLAAAVRNQKKGRRVNSRVRWNDLHKSTMLVLMAAQKNACTIVVIVAYESVCGFHQMNASPEKSSPTEERGVGFDVGV